MATVYKSKTDAWLLAILAVAIAVSLFAAIVTVSDGSPAAWPVAAFIAVIGVGLPIWLLLSTRYTLEPRQLRVQSGPFKWHIKVADITSITPSSNALSSPALSLDRLRIDYGSGRSLMISPRNKEQFLRDIEAARRGAA
ncbi:PH domain-containing protein [Luteimonas sp. MC1895]|uniref:PH domain-containing protein n=1 Tax=Luteimonas sp. MC1895 TaxID=2819513 RepID=UPI0018F0F35B|nr:PH domain-containing protein [Luteimonas sp. MC1895]MBJ6979256.1 PH domain-containing protein [Luteimonas sp. MC1895]